MFCVFCDALFDSWVLAQKKGAKMRFMTFEKEELIKNMKKEVVWISWKLGWLCSYGIDDELIIAYLKS